MIDPTQLLLVRHGESTWNAAGRWQGQADPPLTERGEQQAITAASTLAGCGVFEGVRTSSLQRARRTGELIAAHAGLELGAAEPQLAERSAGPWEGLSRAQIDERYPGWLAAGRRPPGYEGDEAVVRRATTSLIAIAAAAPGCRLIVVTHGGVINALERTCSDTWLRLGNLEARWFECTGNGVKPTGDRVHLVDEASASAGPQLDTA